MNHRLSLSCAALLAILPVATGESPRRAAGSSPLADQPTTQPAATGVVVLDTTGFWRMHHTLQPPVVQTDGDVTPLLQPRTWLNMETPEPTANWNQSDFDDGAWTRGWWRSTRRTRRSWAAGRS